ncbi:hypothetical protein J4221_06885 [Candidatus Pacearchaeota archaeon]|nr:hypothetical protein [Candidatus Pacearchaeota archaeon]
MVFNINQFFCDIFPRINDFGKYALAIQNGVHIMQKDYIDKLIVNTALTDADFIVQEGLLRTFLVNGYDFRTLTEENSPYNEKFSLENDILVSLDPIDETLAYMNNLPNFCIILGVFRKGKLEGSLIHTPAYEKCYCASVEEENAWIWEKDIDNRFKRNSFSYSLNDENIVFTYKAPDDLVRKLERSGLKVYSGEKNASLEGITAHSILRGKISAFFRTNAPAIDWGPISLIMEKGGGFVTDYEGKREGIYQYWNRKDKWRDSRIPSLVVSGNEEIHNKILNLIRNEK